VYHYKLKILKVMKNTRVITLLLITLFWSFSCSEDFLEVSPPGAYSTPSLQNAKGVEGMLIATYAGLDGSWFVDWGTNHFNQHGGASNWQWGSMRSDDAYKGTEPSDWVDGNPIERSEVQPNIPQLANKWNASYDGIARANTTINALINSESEFSTADYNRIMGEARALRGFYHFEAAKVFGPGAAYVDETVEDLNGVQNPNATGGAIIWDDIEADLQFAYDNLPGTMNAPGRINKYAAGALLARCHLFQAEWSAAQTVLNDIIANGTTAAGAPLALTPNFNHNFNAMYENGNTEVMFAYEASYGDGSIANGNYENTLNVPHGAAARTSCCGFFQPSTNLANSFQVDPTTGLPLDNLGFDTFIRDDEGIASTDAFDPYGTLAGETVDARIDWTIGRRGIPFLDWGVNPGSTGGWVRNVPNGGVYNPMKTVPSFAEFDASLAGVIDWGFVSTAKNNNLVRYADVLLMAAEAAAELGDLGSAVTYVDQVRARAADPAGWVTTDGTTPAANYMVGLYGSFASQADALKAIRFERKIELAMEGHRMFDLVRYHLNSGSSALPFDIVSFMNDYYTSESVRRSHLAGAVFNSHDIWLPVPESIIAVATVGGVRNLEQNDGF
jgi:hypothetical protein